MQSSATQVECEIEDDFHHFRVVFTHDGERVLKISAEPVRFPWSACGKPSAQHFAQLQGMQLQPLRDLLSRSDYFDYCTHMCDIFDLGVQLLERGDSIRLYEVEVDVASDGPAEKAVIWRDGIERLRVGLNRGTITTPDQLAGVTVDELYGWAQKNFSDEKRNGEHIELLGVLQRAIYVSFGKGYDWSDRRTADMMGLPPVCFTMATERAATARRMQGTEQDFSSSADKLLDGQVVKLREKARSVTGRDAAT